MKTLPWFRMYSDFLDDPKLISYIISTSSLDGRNQRRNSRAHPNGKRLFLFPCCAGAASFLAGRVEASKGALVPLASPSTLRGLPPTLDGVGGRYTTCSKGAFHG